MHRILVEEKRWISESRFLFALSYCTLLPGPEAQQLATYVGWLLHRTPGALAAGVLFVLPGALVVLALSVLYVVFREQRTVEALFYGLKPAVLAVVIEALLRIGRRTLVSGAARALAALAFVAIFLLEVPFPWIVAGAGSLGALASSWFASASATSGPAPGAAADPDSVAARLDASPPPHTRPDARRALRTLVVCLALWAAPPLAAAAWFGRTSVFVEIAAFFSRAAVVTFGGAYAVLGYIAQHAVNRHGWLGPGEMLDGLGLAETTPGPLILVTQFVGFVAAYREGAGLDPLAAGVLGAALTTWVTFVPCFLWILVGAPWVEALRGSRRLASALAGVTAAVVGVVLNLAVWFALHVVFARVGELRLAGLRILVPAWESLDAAACVLAACALVAMLRMGLGMLPTLAACAAAGALVRLALVG
jgi:chromate transporter